jgi:uncharacterized membrane protein YeaQ/YmgE (transglycosylase-associated protein family)
MLLLEIIKPNEQFASISNEIAKHPIALWIIGGLIAGYIASRIVNSRGEGIVRDILLGIVGSVIGGWIFDYYRWGKVTGFNLMSLLIAVVGGVIFLVVYHALFRRYRFRRA